MEEKAIQTNTGGLNSRVFYEEPNATLYCGHVLEIMKLMPSESVDMVLTSPPYW